MSTPNNEKDHREGLWDPERPATRKRSLPKSRVSPTLWFMIGLVLVAALIGVFM